MKTGLSNNKKNLWRHVFNFNKRDLSMNWKNLNQTKRIRQLKRSQKKN